MEVACRNGSSGLSRLYQEGAGKARFPRRGAAARSEPVEAVLLNTAGGITGGDLLSYRLAAGPDARLLATTQAAEKIYRSLGDEGVLEAGLELGAGAQLAWLPQETILFDGARLRRSLDVDMAEDASLLALESLVFGRRAMGETVRTAFVSDQWRIRRGGRLVYADAFRLQERGGRTLARRGVLDGATAAASLVYVAPDAEARLEEARALLPPWPEVEAGASAWDGLLALRVVAREGAALRRALVGFLEGFRAAPLPRVWRL